MVSIGDLYTVLQVDPAAEYEVIRAAYRALAARHHPDVGGSEQRMAELNYAWTVLSDRSARAAYDRERRLRNNGDRWDAYAPQAADTSPGSSGTIIEFGRYAGWSVPEVARNDPDYLAWLARTPYGRRYRAEIDELMSESTVATVIASPRKRSGLPPRCRPS